MERLYGFVAILKWFCFGMKMGNVKFGECARAVPETAFGCSSREIVLSMRKK